MDLFKKKPTKLTAWASIQMKTDNQVEINISGHIGVPEWWQFEPEMEKELIATKEKMQAELKSYSNLKAKNIKVNVDSLGGDFNHAQAMATALSKTGAEIEVEYTGWSASAATVFGPIATDNNVSMAPTNMILIHEARGCECGVSSTIRAYADMLDKVNATMHTAYSNQTGQSKEAIAALMSKNNGEGEWLTADEALAHGLISRINEPLKAAASYDLSRLSKFGYKVPQNKLNNLNMKFGKKEPIINALAMQDGVTFLHEGELKEGTVLQKAGEHVELKGEHVCADGRKIVIGDGNNVESIVEATTETVGDENAGVVAEVAEILAEFQTKMEKMVDDKIAEMRKKGSTKEVPKVGLTSHEDGKIGTQATAKANVRAHLKEIQDKKKQNRE